jgi:hypothetical protein
VPENDCLVRCPQPVGQPPDRRGPTAEIGLKLFAFPAAWCFVALSISPGVNPRFNPREATHRSLRLQTPIWLDARAFHPFGRRLSYVGTMGQQRDQWRSNTSGKTGERPLIEGGAGVEMQVRVSCVPTHLCALWRCSLGKPLSGGCRYHGWGQCIRGVIKAKQLVLLEHEPIVLSRIRA